MWTICGGLGFGAANADDAPNVLSRTGLAMAPIAMKELALNRRSRRLMPALGRGWAVACGATMSLMLRFLSIRSEIQHGWSRYRSAGDSGRPGDSGGNSSAHRDAIRPSAPCAESRSRAAID